MKQGLSRSGGIKSPRGHFPPLDMQHEIPPNLAGVRSHLAGLAIVSHMNTNFICINKGHADFTRGVSRLTALILTRLVSCSQFLIATPNIIEADENCFTEQEETSQVFSEEPRSISTEASKMRVLAEDETVRTKQLKDGDNQEVYDIS